MTSDRVGTWLSIIANFGVVIGLVLLVLEIRHSTMATEAILYQENINYGRDQIELLLSDENKDLAEIVYRAEKDPDSLSDIEFEKFALFTAWRMAVWETMFMNRDEGLVDDRHWLNTDAWYASILSRGPGYSRWWEAVRHGYDQGFQEHVDRAFKEQQAAPIAQ
jgi:hypothetical protein